MTIMLTPNQVTTLQGLVQNYSGLLATRFFLGKYCTWPVSHVVALHLSHPSNHVQASLRRECSQAPSISLECGIGAMKPNAAILFSSQAQRLLELSVAYLPLRLAR